MNRIGVVLFAGALASALGACGVGDEDEDPGCAALCDKAEVCGDDRGECMADCPGMGYPRELLECMADLSCTYSDGEAEDCLRAIQPTPNCQAGCEKLVGCFDDQPGYPDVELCAASCTLEYSTSTQQCLAEMDEACSSASSCLS